MGKVRIKQRMLVHWKVLRHPVTDRVFQMTDPEIIIAGPSSPGEQRMHDTCACARYRLIFGRREGRQIRSRYCVIDMNPTGPYGQEV